MFHPKVPGAMGVIQFPETSESLVRVQSLLDSAHRQKLRLFCVPSTCLNYLDVRMIPSLLNDTQVDHAKWIIIKKMRIRVCIVLWKGEGTPLEGRKTEMCLSQGTSRHLFGKRTQPSSSSVNLAFYFPGLRYNAQTQNISKRQNSSF